MKAYKYIEKSREYVDYLERHIQNIEKAWKVVKENCADMRFIRDDAFFHQLDRDIQLHDISKFSEHEFSQYRDAFFSIDDTSRDLGDAWEHHKKYNSHHWENWTKRDTINFHPDDWEVDCAHMVIDWMAMGYEFNDTAQEYYEKNADRIILPEIAVEFIYEIFKRVYR